MFLFSCDVNNAKNMSADIVKRNAEVALLSLSFVETFQIKDITYNNPNAIIIHSILTIARELHPLGWRGIAINPFFS